MVDLQQIKPRLGNPDLSTTSIIVEDLKRHGYTGDITEHLKSIADCVNNKQGVLVRFSNTVFFGVTVEPFVFSIHLYTVDSPRDLMGAINASIETAKYSGIKRIGATTKQYQIVNLLKRMNYPIEVQQHGDDVTWSLEIKSEI
jgi:hypothetical protein